MMMMMHQLQMLMFSCYLLAFPMDKYHQVLVFYILFNMLFLSVIKTAMSHWIEVCMTLKWKDLQKINLLFPQHNK